LQNLTRKSKNSDLKIKKT